MARWAFSKDPPMTREDVMFYEDREKISAAAASRRLVTNAIADAKDKLNSPRQEKNYIFLRAALFLLRKELEGRDNRTLTKK